MSESIDKPVEKTRADSKQRLIDSVPSLLASTPEELSRVNALLDKSIPSYRQAYSDRTSWIMACLSELAYIKFDPLLLPAEKKERFLAEVNALIDDNKKASLAKLIDLFAYNPTEEREKLAAELGLLRLELEETFSIDGTQAILVANDNLIALAFRGTEANSIKDIKADARAYTVNCESGGKVHAGFNRCFESIVLGLQRTLDQDKYKSKPLFITGHSLGGALATVAAKRLTHQGGIAACYTFGSPRVGDEEWVAGLKTPVYRLVNAADCVTMLPPGAEIITVISWLVQFIPLVGLRLKAMLLSKFNGYLHAGNMRYLTNCKKGQFDNVRLLYSVSLFYRLKALLIKKLPISMFLADHSISVYRKKLKVVADSRN